VESKLSDSLKISVMGKEIVGSEVFLGEAEIRLHDLVNFSLQDYERDLFGTVSGTIWVRLRWISISHNQEYLSTSDENFDRYGFPVSSKVAYDEVLKTESKYLNIDIPSLQNINSDPLQTAAETGIGFPYKARYWQTFAMKFLKLKISPFPQGLYDQLLRQSVSPMILSQIEKDIPRTFPNHPAFMTEAGRAALGRILKAFSLKHPFIGYIQSMNFISGYLLLLMEEELAFKVLTIIVEYYIPGYYMHTMVDLQADLLVLKDLVKERLPEVYHHLESHSAELTVVTTKWFLCLFIHVLPFPTVLRLWDILFCKGSITLIVAAFTIIYYKKDEILSREDIGPENLDKLCQIDYNWEKFIGLMFKDQDIFKHIGKLRNEAHAKMEILLRESQYTEILKRSNFTREELETLFHQFSKQSLNGCLNKEGFIHLLPEELECFNSDKSVISALFRLFDKNGYGVITFQEYCMGLALFMKSELKERVYGVFMMFDLDKDGFISKEELRFMVEWQFRSMGFTNNETMVQISVAMAFDEYDKDKDGKLSLREFDTVVKKQPFFLKLSY
jgi:Ca2+-binding EF-hand superfamily protein